MSCDVGEATESLENGQITHDHTHTYVSITPWEEEGHKCKDNISGTLAIKTLKETSKVNF